MRKLAKGLTAVGISVSLMGPVGVMTSAEAATEPHHFQNCTAMHKQFPHGVGLFGAHDHTSGDPVTNFKRAPRWYKKNTTLDRDKDHIACEAH